MLEKVLSPQNSKYLTSALELWTAAVYSFATLFFMLGIYINLFRPNDMFHQRGKVGIFFVIATVIWGISLIIRKYLPKNDPFQNIKSSIILREFLYHGYALAFTFALLSFFHATRAFIPTFYNNANTVDTIFRIAFVMWGVSLLFIVSFVLALFIMNRILKIFLKPNTEGIINDQFAMEAVIKKNPYLDFFLGLIMMIVGLGLPIALFMIVQKYGSIAGFSVHSLFERYVALAYFAAGIPLLYYGNVIFKGSKILNYVEKLKDKD